MANERQPEPTGNIEMKYRARFKVEGEPLLRIEDFTQTSDVWAKVEGDERYNQIDKETPGRKVTYVSLYNMSQERERAQREGDKYTGPSNIKGRTPDEFPDGGC